MRFMSCLKSRMNDQFLSGIKNNKVKFVLLLVKSASCSRIKLLLTKKNIDDSYTSLSGKCFE